MSWLEQYDTLTLVHVPQREKVYQEDNDSSGCFILWSCDLFQVHDAKGLVCEIDIFAITPATLLSYANLAAKIIDCGRCDKQLSP